MQLRFLGIGAAFYPALGNTGAFFTRGDDLFLIDCGETAFSKLMRAKVLERYPGRITVLLTHLHADHCGSLGTLALYAAEVLKRPLTIVHPHEEVRTLLSCMGAKRDQYTLVDAYNEGGLSARPVPSPHIPHVPAFSFFITDEVGTYFYSGDNSVLNEEALHGLREGRIAHIWQEVSQFDTLPALPPHLPFETLCRLVKPALRSRFTLMHFNCDFREEALTEGFGVAQIDPIFV